MTAYAGALLNIDAFNHAGVEESKVASYAVMGYESEKHSAKREEMKNAPPQTPIISSKASPQTSHGRRVVAFAYHTKPPARDGAGVGAANRARTDTEFLPKDFKSFVSANSTIAARMAVD